MSISNAMKEMARDNVGFRQPRRKPWLTDEAMDIIDSKAGARKAREKIEYKRLQVVFRGKAKHDREMYYKLLARPALKAVVFY